MHGTSILAEEDTTHQQWRLPFGRSSLLHWGLVVVEGRLGLELVDPVHLVLVELQLLAGPRSLGRRGEDLLLAHLLLELGCLGLLGLKLLYELLMLLIGFNHMDLVVPELNQTFAVEHVESGISSLPLLRTAFDFIIWKLEPLEATGTQKWDNLEGEMINWSLTAHRLRPDEGLIAFVIHLNAEVVVFDYSFMAVVASLIDPHPEGRALGVDDLF